MSVFLSELAESKLLKFSDFLLENWNIKVRNNFIKKTTFKINQISNQPGSYPQSTEFKELFKCLMTKQTTFPYRLTSKNKKLR